MTRIRPAELDERLDSGAPPFVLDIRPRPDFQKTAIENSQNVPVYSDLQSGNESPLRDRLDEIPRDRDVVVVCKLGMVAKRATTVLDEEGYDAATLLGGISGWNGYQAGSLGYKLRSLRWKYL
ncbi:rhodanese-like domain-containing protein [Halovivax cerinus]|uniref:Rhodanese-like domain-containing protein n=1 Tax=Halovivax cerinus TaxID=1487865 RepID=A0ABD5NNF3_9EURY|nr:rhodanese-like domain-containing protein [Halovivax cerinus]